MANILYSPDTEAVFLRAVDRTEPDLTALFWSHLLPQSFLSDTTVLKVLRRHLVHRHFSVRLYVAALLQELDAEDGLTHLVYQAVARHPLLQLDQRGSDQHDLPGLACQEILPHCYQLEGRHTAILVNDIECPIANYQVDILASAPFSTVEDQCRQLMLRGRKERLCAAYVLASNGKADGNELLKEEILRILSDAESLPIIRREHNMRMLLVALSHVSSEATERLCEYVRLNIARAISGDQLESPFIAWLQILLKFIRGHRSIVDIIQENFSRIINHKGGCQRVLCAQSNRNEGFWLPDLLWHFASESDVRQLAIIQRESIETFFDSGGDFSGDFFPLDVLVGRRTARLGILLRGERTPLGVSVRVSRRDYLDMATEWLAKPNLHRKGSHFQL